MLIEIDDRYINWVRSEAGPTKPTPAEITEYINEVLLGHKDSWDDIEDED